MRKLGLLTWLAFLALRPILKASRPWRRGSVWAPRRTAKNLGPPEPNCTRGQSKSSNLSRWRNELINLNFDIFWFWPRMPNGGPFRAGEGKRKNTVTNIYTQYMKKWRQHHRWKKKQRHCDTETRYRWFGQHQTSRQIDASGRNLYWNLPLEKWPSRPSTWVPQQYSLHPALHI